MGGNIVLNLIRTTFAALIAIFLFILVGQRNQIEDRMRSIQDAQAESTARDEATARTLKALGKKVDRIDKAIRSGAITAAPTNGGVSVPVDEELDPRTLAYWPNEDNILVDLSNEPEPPADAPAGGEINFFVGSNMRSLNPFVNSDVDQTDRICTYVYEYLASNSMANPDDLVPGLANRVTISEDKKVFGVYLRKGVMWHEPWLTDDERRGGYKWLADLPTQEVSAHDIKFTFDIVRHPLSECSSQASYLSDLERIEIVDRYTLKFHWNTARYYNKASTLGLLMMLPQHIFGRDDDGNELSIEDAAQRLQNHWYNKRMCGTGPMQFAEFADNSHIRLERNEDYWGSKPKIDAIVLKIVEDPEMRLSLFKTGQLDLFRPEPAQWEAEYVKATHENSLKQLEENGAVTLHTITAFVYRYIGWNQKRPIFRDRAVRRALAHCFPKDRVIRDIFFGLAAPHDAPVHPDLPYYVKDLEQFPYDLDKARALLDEAGWKPNEQGIREKVVDGEKLQLDFKILMPNSRPIYRKFGLVFQKELAKVGVKMKLDLREWQKMITQLDNKDFDACSLGWGLSYDSDESQIWGPEEADKPRSSNHIAYKSKELGEVIEQLGLEFDPEKRMKLHERFQRVIVRDQPYLFLNVPKMPWFVRNRLGNHYFNKMRPQVYLLPWFVKE
ncbi:MAG: ABC transporter substrate-binding protein [Planctomycetota bacterium]|jgi:peptide/nickel transport system substrate-binding protein